MSTNANEDHQEIHDNVFRIIVKIRDGLRLHSGMNFCNNFSDYSYKKLLSISPKQLAKLIRQAQKTGNYKEADFFNYYAINCPMNVDFNELLSCLQNNTNVELAYVENGPGIPPYYLLKSAKEIFDFGFLCEAPEGINAIHAWNFEGGRGSDKISFIDIEQGWNLHHRDISVKALPNTGINNHNFSDHGTATLGVVLMQNEKLKRFGIVSKVNASVISQWRPDGYMNTADAIVNAITKLKFGDVLLLETQGFDSAQNEKAFPIEVHEATYQAIKLATALGVIVVETAGNGDLISGLGHDLDNYKIDGKAIFNRRSKYFKDSGAIIVGASSSAVPHDRMRFSNYGNRIDCYAWGENVATTGSYPYSTGMPNSYTQSFSGTSSAAAIIAGAAISIQSIYEKNFNDRLSPEQMRVIISNKCFGTSSRNGSAVDKIGIMPDLRKIIEIKFKLRRSRASFD